MTKYAIQFLPNRKLTDDEWMEIYSFFDWERPVNGMYISNHNVVDTILAFQALLAKLDWLVPVWARLYRIEETSNLMPIVRRR